jgi:hypothetical protein
VESFFPLLKAGSSGIHHADPIVRTTRVGHSRQISNFETDERTHYPAFAECVCAENVLNFAMPAKPDQAVKKQRSAGYSVLSGDNEAEGIGTSSARTSEVSARENSCPLQLFRAMRG